MQFDDLERQWRQIDQKLDRSLALETQLLREIMASPARRRVQRQAIWPAINVAFCVGVLGFCGNFLHSHQDDWRLASLASIVVGGALALLVASIRQLIAVAELDWCGPVAAIQASLDRLRLMAIQQFKWVILLSPLMGFSALMVGLAWLVNWGADDRVDILAKMNGAWVVTNLVFGVLFVPFGYLAAHWLASQCSGRPWWRETMNAISGKSLHAAAKDIERWASLMREQGVDENDAA